MVLTPVIIVKVAVLVKAVQLLNILLRSVNEALVVKLIGLLNAIHPLNIPDIVLTPVNNNKALAANTVPLKRIQLLNMLLISVSEASVANVKF